MTASRRMAMSAGICLGVLLVSAILTQGAAEQASPDRLLEMGRSSWEAGEYPLAIQYFSDSLEGFRSGNNRHGEAEALQGLGACHEDLGQFAVARDHYEAALDIFEGLSDRAAQGDSHICLGWTHLGLGLPVEAFEHFERAHAIFSDLSDAKGRQGSLRGLSEAVDQLASRNADRGDAQEYSQSAILYLERALTFYRLADDEAGEAYCLLYLARCHDAIGDRATVLIDLQEALGLFRTLEDQNGEIDTLHRMAWLCEREEDWGQAVELYEQTIELAEAMGDRRRVADSLLSVAGCRMALGLYQRALQSLQQARAEFAALLDPRAEIECLRVMGLCYAAMGDLEQSEAMQRKAADRAGEAGIWLLRADLLCELAGPKMPRGEFQAAIDLLEEARTLYQREDNLSGVASCMTMLGDCFQMLASFDIARVHFESAHDISVAIGDRPNEASSLHGIGVCDYYSGEYAEAIAKTQEALEIYRSIPGEDHGEAWCLFQIGCNYEASGSIRDATAYTEEALTIFRRLGDPMGIQAALTSMAICRRRTFDRSAALAYYEEALQVAAEIGAVHEMWNIEWAIGSLHQELGNLEEALGYYELALARAESILEAVRIEGAIQSYLGRMSDAYAEYLELLLWLNREQETLLVAERCRARTFLDSIGGSPEISFSGIPERGIRARVVNSAAIDEDLQEVIAGLPERTAALEYFTVQDRTYLWVIKRAQVEGPFVLGSTRDALRTRVVELREAIETYAGGLSGYPEDAFLALCSTLFEILIRPAENHLTGIEHLVIVPSGPLFYLPFGALMSCYSCTGADYLGGEYLIEQYSISYAPSLATLRYCEGVGEDETAFGDLLALADPDSGDPTLPRLPEALSEAQAVLDIVGAGQLYSGDQATEGRLSSEGQAAENLLLSTHGYFDPENPMYSYLQLAPSSGTDGRLYTYEVFALSLNANLVTLGACETLLPALAEAKQAVREERGLMHEDPVELDAELLDDLTEGDEIVGLTRAFIYAGARSVLSTLWRVVSETTEPLMVAFYIYLAGGMEKADALQHAQLDVMASYPHPRYWAAFELVGDWR